VRFGEQDAPRVHHLLTDNARNYTISRDFAATVTVIGCPAQDHQAHLYLAEGDLEVAGRASVLLRGEAAKDAERSSCGKRTQCFAGGRSAGSAGSQRTDLAGSLSRLIPRRAGASRSQSFPVLLGLHCMLIG
jgi:hypothetical protein